MDGPGRRPLRRLVTEPGPRTTKAAVVLLRPVLRRLTRNRFSGLEHIPAQGGAIVAANHISNFDPLALAHFVVESGRWPYFLAKASLFTRPVLGALLRSAGQIPVQRGSVAAKQALAAARAAIDDGRVVIIYPEGTITADPDGWPMTAQPGAAVLALQTGAPLIPVGQWGAQAVLGMKRMAWPRLIPRPTVAVRAGAAIALDDLAPQDPVDPAAVAETVRRLMGAVTAIVGELRGQEPPPSAFDYRSWREHHGGSR